MAAPPVSEEPLSEEERWQQLVQKACKATWNGQNLDAEVYRQITYSGDIVRLGFYETETFLYSVKGERCYSLDRNTYRWQDGGAASVIPNRTATCRATLPMAVCISRTARENIGI